MPIEVEVDQRVPGAQVLSNLFILIGVSWFDLIPKPTFECDMHFLLFP